MRHISKVVVNYVKIHCSRVAVLDKKFLPDIKLMAAAREDPSDETIKVTSWKRKIGPVSADLISQLLKIILLAAINSPKGTHYLGRMPNLTVPTQQSIRTIIQEVSPLDPQGVLSPTNAHQVSKKNENIKRPVSPMGKEPNPGEGYRPGQLDPEFLYEERLGKALAANKVLAEGNDDLQQEISGLVTRLKELESDHVSRSNIV